MTDKKITTLDGDFDGAVRRITTAYQTDGQVDTVTQYDAATAGNVVDQIQYTFDDWDNLTKFAMDRNSVISGGTDASDGYYDVDYAYAKAASANGGRQTIRRTSMTWPDGTSATYEYLSTFDLFDDDLSRLTRIKVGATTVVQYAYTGMGQVVKTEYPQPDVMWEVHGSTTGSYPDIDRFNRVTSSRWTKDLATDVDFYDVDLTYDRNSGITLAEDNIHVGFDVSYTNDSINRLTKAEEGTWGGSSISSRTREQNWTLDQLGNWDVAKLDLDGDNNWNETNEYNDDRTHNDFNELTGRDTDDNGTDDYTLVYDEVGNLTDDGENYEYLYDPFGRLRKITKTTDQSLVAEYWYNGLGYRITVHEDTDTDGDVDVNDEKHHLIYNDRWQMVALFVDDSDTPREQFLYHMAGLDGRGGSSYIDGVVLRQKDTNDDGTMDQRYYYCQNWRSDVSAIVTSGGKMMEWIKYSAYGIPFALPAGDTDSDGDCDQTDIDNIDNWISGYDVRLDLDLDGDIDATDSSRASSTFQGTTLGWNVLTAVGNRKGYTGHEHDEAVGLIHMRNRAYKANLGRFVRRDPLGYVDGMSLYEYIRSWPIVLRDPYGTSFRLIGFHPYVPPPHKFPNPFGPLRPDPDPGPGPGPGPITVPIDPTPIGSPPPPIAFCDGDNLDYDSHFTGDPCKEMRRLGQMQDKWCGKHDVNKQACNNECRRVAGNKICGYLGDGLKPKEYCAKCYRRMDDFDRSTFMPDCPVNEEWGACCDLARAAFLAAATECALIQWLTGKLQDLALKSSFGRS